MKYSQLPRKIMGFFNGFYFNKLMKSPDTFLLIKHTMQNL